MRMKVRAVGTTDDPADTLEHHIAYAMRKPGEPLMVPSYRPDKALAVENPAEWKVYVEKLGSVANISIASYKDLVTALDKCHQVFHDLWPRFRPRPDRTGSYFCHGTGAGSLFAKLMKGEMLSQDEVEAFKTELLLEVGRMNAKRGWAMQTPCRHP